MQIQARAVTQPIYLNASADFGRWFSHNWRRLEAYYEALGGSKYDTAEYIAFCRCQHDQQSVSERDVKQVNEAADANARLRVVNISA